MIIEIVLYLIIQGYCLTLKSIIKGRYKMTKFKKDYLKNAKTTKQVNRTSYAMGEYPYDNILKRGFTIKQAMKLKLRMWGNHILIGKRYHYTVDPSFPEILNVYL